MGTWLGDGLDPVNLTACLRKKVAYAELVTVEVVGAEEKKPGPKTTADMFSQQWYHPGYNYWTAAPYSDPDVHCYPYRM